MIEKKLVIIGGGPAGLTAAIYTSRAGLKPLIIEGNMPGGQLMGTTYVENWPGDKQILGPRLMIQMREHAAHFGAEFLSEEVVSAQLRQRPFSLVTNANKTIHTDCLIVATGATYKRLGCPGEDEYWGKGVTTCAVCDGAFYRDRKVIIVGGGDTAMEDASFMTNFTNDITIVHILDKLTASHAMQERILNNPAIKIIYSSTITKIEGDGNHVTHVTITNQNDGTSKKVTTDALFVAIGLKPNTGIFVNQLDLNHYGYIVHKEHTQTSIPGVFAAGDVVDYRYRQAITSAGSGCMAALDAERYLKGL
jgi:thioredoxin reductase (NADPH)